MCVCVCVCVREQTVWAVYSDSPSGWPHKASEMVTKVITCLVQWEFPGETCRGMPFYPRAQKR